MEESGGHVLEIYSEKRRETSFGGVRRMSRARIPILSAPLFGLFIEKKAKGIKQIKVKMCGLRLAVHANSPFGSCIAPCPFAGSINAYNRAQRPLKGK